MNEVSDARREGRLCCFLRHDQVRRQQHRSSLIVGQTLPVSEQFEVLDKKKGVSPRFSKKPLAPCFDAFIHFRLSLASIPRCAFTGTEERLDQPQRLLKGERDEGLAPDRQGPFQAAQPISKRYAPCQVVGAEGAEQEHREVCACPAPAGILQYVERRRICPLRIIDEKDDR